MARALTCMHAPARRFSFDSSHPIGSEVRSEVPGSFEAERWRGDLQGCLARKLKSMLPSSIVESENFVCLGISRGCAVKRKRLSEDACLLVSEGKAGHSIGISPVPVQETFPVHPCTLASYGRVKLSTPASYQERSRRSPAIHGFECLVYSNTSSLCLLWSVHCLLCLR
jgi:hypothetical protein